MGVFDKIKKKMSDTFEKVVSNNMSGASKEEYEKEKANLSKQTDTDSASSTENINANYTKEDLADLEQLLKKAGALDNQNIWIAGFSNIKHGQNATAANLFSGKNNLKFLTHKDGLFYMLGFNKGVISSYKIFQKADVAKVEAKDSLLTKTFKVVLKDKTTYTVDVKENKDKTKQLNNILL